MKKEIAMNDLRCKIEHFKEQYECLSRRNEPHLSFIKVINGGEDISVHNISGQLQSKVLYYISNFRAQPRTLYFSRVSISQFSRFSFVVWIVEITFSTFFFFFLLFKHGESEFNLLGRIGGDANLSPRGMQYAQSLARYFNQASVKGLKIWTSEKRRTNQTAHGILAPIESFEELNELDAVSSFLQILTSNFFFLPLPFPFYSASPSLRKNCVLSKKFKSRHKLKIISNEIV